jgi:signal-transduction protein with cAMP-binding, CBS, and nucleotidyltransferase domain
VNAIEKLARQENEILTQISLAHKEVRETEVKVARLRKQRKLLLRRMKELGDREIQNIFELEVNEMLAEKPPFEFFPEILPFLSPSQVSQGSPYRTPATPFRSG